MAETLRPARRNTFIFEGRAIINDNSFSFNSSNTNGTWVYNNLNFGIDCGEHGINYVNLMGGYNPNGENYISISTLDEDGKIQPWENNIKVDWDDRESFDIDSVPNINKNSLMTLRIEKDANGKVIPKTFLTPYDAIVYISEHISDKDCIVVRGHLDYRVDESGSNWMTSHIIDSIDIKQESLLQPKAILNLTLLISADSVGKPNVEDRNVPIYGKSLFYINKMNKKIYKTTCGVPVKFLFDINTLDINNPEDKKKFDYGMKNYFSAEKDFYNEVLFRCHYTGGVKKVEINIEDLPKEIREGIEYGFIDKDQVMGAMAIKNPVNKDIVFSNVITENEVITDEKTGITINKPVPVITKKKYKITDIPDFTDLEELDAPNTSTSSTSKTDNIIEDDEIDEATNNILSMFATMD